MSEPDVNVVLVNFPNSGKEMVVKNEDDTYTILINARLSNDGQLKAYQHAMKHIENDDFEKADAQQIEAVAHGLAVNPKAKPMPAAIYLERINRLKRSIRRIERQIQRDQERVQFLQEHGDVFTMEENRYLYGKDL